MNDSVFSLFPSKGNGDTILGSRYFISGFSDDGWEAWTGGGAGQLAGEGTWPSAGGSYKVLEQHLTVICGLAQRQFPRYKSKRHGLTQRRRQGKMNG